MSRILLIGDSYPLFTYKAEENIRIAEMLKQNGHDIYLLSTAWCVVKEDDFYGDVEFLSNPYPFTKRFYVDPLQVRAANIGLLSPMSGLCMKILEQEKIEVVIFADDLTYLPMIELCRNRFDIPYYLLLFHDEQIKYRLLDDYLYPLFQTGFQAFRKIFTFPFYQQTLIENFQVEESRIDTSLPALNQGKNAATSLEECKTIFVFIDPYSNAYAKYIYTIAKEAFDGTKTALRLCTPNGSDNGTALGLDPEVCVRLNEIPENAFVIQSYDLATSESTCLGWIMFAQNQCWYPVIRKQDVPRLGNTITAGFDMGAYYVIQQSHYPGRDFQSVLTEEITNALTSKSEE